MKNEQISFRLNERERKEFDENSKLFGQENRTDYIMFLHKTFGKPIADILKTVPFDRKNWIQKLTTCQECGFNMGLSSSCPKCTK